MVALVILQVLPVLEQEILLLQLHHKDFLVVMLAQVYLLMLVAAAVEQLLQEQLEVMFLILQGLDNQVQEELERQLQLMEHRQQELEVGEVERVLREPNRVVLVLVVVVAVDKHLGQILLLELLIQVEDQVEAMDQEAVVEAVVQE